VAGQVAEAAQDAAAAVEGVDAAAVDGVQGEPATSAVAGAGMAGAPDPARAADGPSAASLEALETLAADVEAGSSLTAQRLQAAVTDVLQADVPGLVEPDAARLIAEALADDPTFIAALRAGATGEGGS